MTGEYLTQETQSVWLFLSDVNLQSAKVFQSLISLSAPADKTYLLSGEKATDKTSLVCPVNILVDFPAFKSHNLRVLSQDEETMKQFSWERAKSVTKWLWPWKALNGYPYWLLTSSSYNFQTIKVLSLDPEMRIGESSFSFYGCPATMEVTQSECPSKVPCEMKSAYYWFSSIFIVFRFCSYEAIFYWINITVCRLSSTGGFWRPAVV